MGDLHDHRAQHLSYLSGSEPEVPAESWGVAEEETRRIIGKIQPTAASEGRRRDAVEYVQRLIKRNLGLEVFPYGSVPLKTYLPDGDIDFTAFGVPNVVDKLVGDVRNLFEFEENNEDAEFEVKDVQYINAEVKLVKCLVQNIVIDISFNQIGGLCTLYFLEKVNTIIGKDNLFKRSIILIKAWCYYESRILGAHHALISTYALETLVLYIFHLFHSSLDGPLVVLYKFLDYFSKFDWDNYCVSLHGPVHVSSLPQIIAEVPHTDGDEPFLSKDLLHECGNLLPLFQRAMEPDHRVFPRKHLNIVDPLKENNNLGRSVSKGNSHRIRSAFAYGARKLGRILLLPKEGMRNALDNFFTNTLERHGSGDRPDLRGARHGVAGRSSLDLSDVNGVLTDVATGSISKDDAAVGSVASDISLGSSSVKVIDDKNPCPENTHSLQKERAVSDRSDVPCMQRQGNIKCLVNRRTSGSTIVDNEHLHVHPEVNKNRHPRLPSTLCEGNGRIADREYCHGYRCKHMESDMYEDGTVSRGLGETEQSYRGTSHSSSRNQLTSLSTPMPGRSNAGLSVSSNGSIDAGDGSTCDALDRSNVADDADRLADLSGDLSAHWDSLSLYAQCSFGSFAGGLSPRFQGSNWGMQPHLNGVVPVPAFPFNHGFQRTSRGTGTYFPNMRQGHPQSRGRPERGKIPHPNRHHSYRSNGHAGGTSQASRSEEAEKGGHEPDVPHRVAAAAAANGGGGRTMLEPFESLPTSPATQSSRDAAPRQFQIAFGSFGPVSLGTTNLLPVKSMDVAPLSPGSPPAPLAAVRRPASSIRGSGKPADTYMLKDEDDFPPLAGWRSLPSPAAAPMNRHKTVWEARGSLGFS